MLALDEQRRLLAKKQELEQLIQNKKELIMIPMSEWTDELSSYDQHSADQGSDLFEREKEMGILEMLEFELEKVNDALSRNNAGLGKICSICGREIEAQRLKRLVNTTVCANCAHVYENAYRIHNEEPPMPGMMSDLGETIQVAGYELYEE